MVGGRTVSALISTALFVVFVFAAGFITAAFTESLVWTAGAGVVAGLVAGWVSNIVRRRMGGGARGGSDDHR